LGNLKSKNVIQPLKKLFMIHKKFLSMMFGALALVTVACDDDDDEPAAPQVYTQEDQKARPAINTVFVSAGEKDVFNTTAPSDMAAAFGTKFKDKLLALNPGYTTNALGHTATDLTSALVTDVLTVSLQGKTTFFDGTNVLTGRLLDDDVINVELLLIFGGPDGTANPGLTDDHVNANDKTFLTTFPYLASPH
jgi:hypothetical protein